MEDLAATEAQLLAWNLLEVGPPLAWSRRFRAAVMRAASDLQQAEAAGKAPAGHPIAVAVAAALGQSYPRLVTSRQQRDFLAAVEVSALPTSVRDLLGKGKS